MFSCYLENEYGDKLKLTGNVNYTGVEIDGLSPAPATIGKKNYSLFDGAKITSRKTNEKPITITFYIDKDVEKSRIAIYKVVQPSELVRLYYKNGTRNVYIDGVVETIDIDYYTIKQFVTISILCQDPFFRDANSHIEDINKVVNLFEFPFSIEKKGIEFGTYEDVKEISLENSGDISTGMQIEIHATGTVRNPIITNVVDKTYFKLNYTLNAGDILCISTYKGRKKVEVFKNGKYENVFNNIAEGSTWLKLAVGTNIYMYDADADDEKYMIVKFIYQNLYRGV